MEIVADYFLISNRNLETLNLKFCLAEMIWKKLGDVPTDDNDCIDRSFDTGYKKCTIPKGTHREDIWKWIEEEFEVSVAEDLMKLD